MLKSIFVLSFVLLAGCAGWGRDASGYDKGPMGMGNISPANAEPMSAKTIGPYCFSHHGYLSGDGRGCAFLSAQGCDVHEVPGLPLQREADLGRWLNMICHGWHPGLHFNQGS